ncbi:MAG: large conductance mechanosensitive channel protein MscL [Patescibacteria group bacterium]|nr:large conductance mechanosensitive channel protein MscL [Patescibacteria group bacterium]
MKGFKQFILRGNMVDLAVGVVVGAAFGAVVKSLVENIITPFIGAIVKAPDFSALTFTINGSKFNYGNFLNALISFLIISTVIYFFVILPINTLVARAKKENNIDPTTKKCKECMSDIPIGAHRCLYCTSVVD